MGDAGHLVNEVLMCNTLRDLAPPTPYDNPSPFVVRGAAGKPASNNPVITGRASSASKDSSDSNSDTSTEDELTYSTSVRPGATSPPRPVPSVVTDLPSADAFPAVRRANRILIPEPDKRDLLVYKRYVNFDKKSSKITNVTGPIHITVSSAFSIDSSVEVIPPTVSRASREMYRQYVDRANGPKTPPHASLLAYQKYVDFTL